MGGMIKCKNCETVLHSLYTHDFQSCECDREEDSVFVDGGFDYTRIGGYPENIEMIEHIHTNPKGKGGKDEIILTDTMLASLM